MDKHGAIIKKLLLGGILLVMLLPLLQRHLKVYESEPLKGAQVAAKEVYFSLDSWWSGDYQVGYEAWFNENFGFRPELVRMHNQVAYSLYNKAKANGVIVGKEDYLYEENYIKAYTGKDYIGRNALALMSGKLKVLQDSLEKKGITLIVCLAAGKASYFPEYIPEEYGPASDSTNYKVLAQLLHEGNVNHIDYNRWFMSMKGKTQYPLYPKTGIHWSNYGALMVTDSLINYIEAKRNVDMPDLIWDKTVLSDSARIPDNDIGEAMNLIWPVKYYALGQPHYHFEDTAGKAHVKMMTIADSYFWNVYNFGLAPTTFSQIDFYFYNTEVYSTNGQPMRYSDVEYNLQNAEQSDVIVLMATECNLGNFGWGFISEAFNRFVLHKMVPSRDGLVKKYESMIRADKEWMKNIQGKADQNNISLDSMIYLDAMYMADEEWKKSNAQ